MNQAALETKIRASFARQTLMRTIGATLGSIGAGRVEITLPFADSLSQQHGYLHAAAIAAIADSAGGCAALSVMDEADEVVAVEFKINFVRPAIGDLFIARGEVVTSGRSLSVCSNRVVGVTGSDERLVAVMSQTCMRIPA